MKILVAIDSLKGCLTSCEANEAVAVGLHRAMPDAEVVFLPVSDGGEGWLEAVEAASGGGRFVADTVDPLGRPMKADFLMLGETAVIEMARTSGLCLIDREERNPLKATSRGTGMLMADAIRRGAKTIVVGLGGSATSDAGRGVAEAMEGVPVDGVKFLAATDVTNPLLGPNGAAHVFAPQKGATPAMVEQLEERARTFAHANAERMGEDHAQDPGAGAAGGVGYAMMQLFGAKRVSGIDWLLDLAGFDALLAQADLVITGEGRADRQTLMGKVPMGILGRAQKYDVPVMLVAGQVDDRDLLLQAGFSHVECFNPAGISLSEAMKPAVARKNLSQIIYTNIIRIYFGNKK